MTPVKALLFDLDGTLIDSRRDLITAVRYVQQRMGVRAGSDTAIASFVGDGVGPLMQRALHGVMPSQIDEGVVLFKAYYREHCLDHTTVYPGVMATLEHFHAKPMAVVTNKPERLSRHILDTLGLLPFFTAVLGGDSAPRKKPHPDGVLQALQALRISDPHTAVMIGDSANDILAGRHAGCRTCGIYSDIGSRLGLRGSKPDFVVLNTHELARIFN